MIFFLIKKKNFKSWIFETFSSYSYELISLA